MSLSVRLAITPSTILLLPLIQPVFAGDVPDLMLKPHGISLELVTQERDLDITDLQLGIPGLDSPTIAFIKNQAEATDQAKAANLRIDYQMKPYLNVFGSAGALQDEVKINFSKLGAGLADMNVASNGMLYGAGFTLMGHDGNLLGTLTYVHHIADMGGSERKVSANTVIPMLGVQTEVGVFSASLDWQDVDDNYSGKITVPGIGDVPVEVSAKNRDELAYSMGFHTQLAKNLYMSADVGFDDRKHALLMVNQRF